jgi:Trypsin-co-occurring domain 1
MVRRSVLKTLIEYPIEGGGSIVVEVNEAEEGVVRAARPGEIAARATQTFESALDIIKPAAAAIVGKLRTLSEVDQVGVEFGIKLGAKAGVYIASTDTEANFKISLTWKRSEK